MKVLWSWGCTCPRWALQLDLANKGCFLGNSSLKIIPLASADLFLKLVTKKTTVPKIINKKCRIWRIKVTATKNSVFEVSLVLRWGRRPLTVFLWKIQISPFRRFDVLVWNAPRGAGTRQLRGDLPMPRWECGTSWTWPTMTGRGCLLAHCHWCHLSSTLCSQLGHQKSSWPHIDCFFQLKPIVPNSRLCVLCPQGIWKLCLMQIIYLFPFNCQNLSKM